MDASNTCPYCNHENPLNSLFCNSCGKSLSDAESKKGWSSIFNKRTILILVGFCIVGLIAWAFSYRSFGGPPDDLILSDRDDSYEIINKSRCENLPGREKALGITEAWVVGLYGEGPYPITTLYVKQAGEWYQAFSNTCP